MAISEMLKLKLVGISARQEELLNLLHATGAVELSSPSKIEGLEKVVTDKSEIRDKKERVERALSIIESKCKEAKKETVKGAFAVLYSDFISICEKEEALLKICDEVKDLNDGIATLSAEIVALKGEKDYLKPYLAVKEKFSFFAPTKKTFLRLGAVDNNLVQKLKENLSAIELCDFEIFGESEKFTSISVVFHESALESVEKTLLECAFIRCAHVGEYTAEEKTNEVNRKINEKNGEIADAKNKITDFSSEIKELKILCDRYSFEIEKKESSDKFERTKNTFYLEAFLPKEKRSAVEEKLTAMGGQIYCEFCEVEEGEFAPTLMKNKKITSNFEFVTNLYSVPQYKEYDPNAIMGFFFSVFLGFITADVAYGLLMIIGGLLFNARSKRKTGINKLAGVIVMAGIPTVLFGLGFDSCLGLPLLRSLGLIAAPLLPDPVSHTSLLAGISIPTLLLICLGMGVIHIMTSLCVLAYTHFKKGRILDGICDGLIWAIFLGGLLLFVLCEIGTVKGLDNVAIGLLVGSVVLGALTAGRNVKGFGKFTKGFGAVYGLINYMSDILSYARLYGLMLSGAKIAEIFSQQLAVPMLENPGGIAGVIMCVLIMLVGHVFNIAMGLLGAFIHDARLQYVEFFSHFYTGDGELFKPLGSEFEHIYIEQTN